MPNVVLLFVRHTHNYGDVERMSMVNGAEDRDGQAFKFAILSIIEQYDDWFNDRKNPPRWRQYYVVRSSTS